MNRLIVTCIATLITCIFSGCATYTPPTMAENQMAKVKEYESAGFFININKINGLPVEAVPSDFNPFKSEAWLKSAHSPPDTFPIPPGACTLDCKMTKGNAFAHGRVTFEAEAGKTYRVMGNVGEKERGFFGPQRVVFFVEDDVTGALVSSLTDETAGTPSIATSNAPNATSNAPNVTSNAPNERLHTQSEQQDSRPSDKSIDSRLQKLKQLKEDGLITEEQYNEKRQSILDQL